ncbi:unnamed protein product [Prorocentrum cordatum]|uniref:Very-long-chain (3R)-3-hydroxyacyl-CoA dehydratase n=1 Tax=Prorocentrum cordatum TaxID=2364126 RepID=A0ABN9TX93_9DINO|nr:unnamed protein product [Polarella glacialis]
MAVRWGRTGSSTSRRACWSGDRLLYRCAVRELSWVAPWCLGRLLLELVGLFFIAITFIFRLWLIATPFDFLFRMARAGVRPRCRVVCQVSFIGDRSWHGSVCFAPFFVVGCCSDTEPVILAKGWGWSSEGPLLTAVVLSADGARESQCVVPFIGVPVVLELFVWGISESSASLLMPASS